MLFSVGNIVVGFQQEYKAAPQRAPSPCIHALGSPHVFLIQKRKVEVLEILITCFYTQN